MTEYRGGSLGRPAVTEDEQIDALVPGEAMAVDWTEAEYFADRRALTRSALGLLPYKPLEFGAWLRGEAFDREETSDMSFGTVLHAALLEPDRFAASMLPKPTKPKHARKGAAAGTPARTAYDKWMAATLAHDAVASMNPHAIPVRDEELERINGIREAVRRHPVASVLLGCEGRAEQTIVWREPTTGMLVKVRVDWLTQLSDADVFGVEIGGGRYLAPGWYACDLKSTESDSPGLLARSAKKFGYQPQASLYTDAAEALVGRPVTWSWIAVTADPCKDGKHGVSVYGLTPDQRERGREIYLAQLHEARDRIQRDDWTPAHRHGVGFLPL